MMPVLDPPAAAFRRNGGAALVRLVAVPVLPQLVAVGGVHGRDQLERVERLAAGVHLLEDDADGFLRRRPSSEITGTSVAS